MKYRYVLFFLVALGVFFYSKGKELKSEKTIGIILPMEHEALSQIVSGLKEELKAEGNVRLKVMNAQGDPNLQRAIVEQLAQGECDLLIPIGTSTSQMTLALAKGKNVLCLAANSSLVQDGFQATALDDELSAADSFTFLRTTFPEVKKITLLYSPSEKVADEIPILERSARENGIEVQKLLVYTMADLYTMSDAIALDSGAVFVLKDHLVVSGMRTVAQQAEKRGIFVMSSDEGSVREGAAFAIGVEEKNIGRQGGEIAKRILQGEAPQEISPHTVAGPFPLFVNRKACSKQKVEVERLQNAGIPIQFVGE